MKTFKLKKEQDEKETIDKIEVDVEITEQVVKTVPITLEQIDQEIKNIDERIALLQTEKAEKEADRILIEKEAKKFKTI